MRIESLNLVREAIGNNRNQKNSERQVPQDGALSSGPAVSVEFSGRTSLQSEPLGLVSSDEAYEALGGVKQAAINGESFSNVHSLDMQRVLALIGD